MSFSNLLTLGAALIPLTTIGVDTYGRAVDLPLIGAGTWQYNDTIAYQSVCQAFAAGYTFVDTALGYGNQKGVGLAIRDCWQGKRDDLFVMTKIPGGLNAVQVMGAHHQNLLDNNNRDLFYVIALFPHQLPGKVDPRRWHCKQSHNAAARVRRYKW
jgi:diketogulonate reductase-like aldo/keto reductase